MQRVRVADWLMYVEKLQKLYERLPFNRFATMRSGAWRNGSSSGKRPTAVGAAFSRRGCIR